MKKQILLLAITTLSLSAFAQKPTIGVEAGLASFGMRGDAVDNLNGLLDFADGMISTKNRTGFYAGINASIPLGAGVSIQPGLHYTQKGYEMVGDFAIKGMEFLGANAKAKLQNDYIDIPVLIKADLGGFQVFAGPQFSYLASSKLRTTASVLGFSLLNETMDAKDQFNSWDMGLTGGIGYQFKQGFSVSASYNHGLSKVDANNNVAGYNNGFKIGVGFNF
ncbi:MAG: PorT family protein [Sphingobacteriales bacterium]|nr:MAG: PorT family protein [Sphingobacteriales bacterium]